MAGYSGTPLPTKLGLKRGHRLAVLGGPDGFADQFSSAGVDCCAACAPRST
ncbi:MAG: hypothetical protein ABIW46_00580 [Acidimicrobiales bacterium]